MYKPELVAPAGSWEGLFAAVNAGADAVYLGVSAFNARRNAKNFESLGEVTAFCHEKGVRVYLALNTIVFDKELNLLVSVIEDAAKSGVDAIIAADMGVARLIHQMCPDMKLHASTQAAVHNKEGAEFVRECGFSRVVPAREMSFEELRTLCGIIETEVFVHGALCYSMSGMCSMSVHFGGRSGNRGLCAGTCRLPFNAGGGGYALSLKDLCGAEHVKTLSGMGVGAFKIEGRMKRPEYVELAVTVYRRLIDGKNVPEELMRALERVFSRSGFTDGYLTGRRINMQGVRKEEDDRVFGAGKWLVTPKREPIEHTTKPFYKLSEDDTNPQNGKSEKQYAQRPPQVWVYPLSEDDTNPQNGKSEKQYAQRPPQVWGAFLKVGQIPAGVKLDRVFLPEEELLRLGEKAGGYGVRLHAVCFDTVKQRERLSRLRACGVRYALCDNPGSFHLARELHFDVTAGYTLNVSNKQVLFSYRDMGAESVILSPELHIKGGQALTGHLPVGIAAYGHLPLMHARLCPKRLSVGCKGCTGQTSITDRRGVRFPVMGDGKGCSYVRILNSVPLYLADKPEIHSFDFILLDFTIEKTDECARIINSYEKGLPSGTQQFTRGLYFKHVL